MEQLSEAKFRWKRLCDLRDILSIFSIKDSKRASNSRFNWLRIEKGQFKFHSLEDG